MSNQPLLRLVLAAFTLATLNAGMIFSAEAPVKAAPEKPAAAEKNPPGDIPDSQVFIDYVSEAGGYALKVPEGWARKVTENQVAWEDKLDGISVILTESANAPTAETVRSQAPEFEKTGRAIRIRRIENINLPAGQAVRIMYESNSEPNAVTGKQGRLENEQYLYFRAGRLATLRLWAPLGADNVDQWQLISRSFRWR